MTTAAAILEREPTRMSGGMSGSMSEKPTPKKTARAAVEAANTWEEDAQARILRSERRAWIVAGCFGGIALLSMGMGLYMSMKPAPAPVPIIVDRTTGETAVVPKLDIDSIPKISALDQHNAAVFVRSRETYFFDFLGRDYEQVARMATPEVFSAYSRRFEGENAMQIKVGNKEEARVTIISARPSSGTKAGRAGEVIVTFDREVKSTSGRPPVTTRYVATLAFEYRPTSVKRDIDRIENPFGFVVTAYRSDAELIAPPTSKENGS